MAEDFSNEGLYRLLERMDREHGADLREIRKQTTLTNGRVSSLETRVDRNDQELKRINSAVFPRHAIAATPSPEAGESFSVKFSPKVWTALAAAAGILFAMAIEWLKQRMARP